MIHKMQGIEKNPIPCNSWTIETEERKEMKMYYDENADCFVSEEQIKKEFIQLKAEQPNEYDYTFEEYLNNCLSKNGFFHKASYYLIDYYTEKIIDVFTDVDKAIVACKATQDSQVETEVDTIIYSNVDLPF